MTRRKKIISDVDGTPVETDEDLPLEEVPAVEPKAAKRLVVWTPKGEELGAWSEHGMHKAGDLVETDLADVLIERGFAREAD